MLLLAWQHGGDDPYRLYHCLDEAYRPLGDPGAPARPPAYPGRQRALIFAFAAVAHEGIRPQRQGSQKKEG